MHRLDVFFYKNHRSTLTIVVVMQSCLFVIDFPSSIILLVMYVLYGRN